MTDWKNRQTRVDLTKQNGKVETSYNPIKIAAYMYMYMYNYTTHHGTTEVAQLKWHVN